MKLGKRPATHDPRDLLFAEYRTGKLPQRPATFGHEKIVPADGWGMLGNDQYGDCVFAGADHETMILTAEGSGHPARFTDEGALGDYAAVTGFHAWDPSTDQGTDVRDAMGYRRSTGLLDAAGHRHRIGAYVSLEPGNLDHLQEALWLFGVVGVGVEFPTSAMSQFNNAVSRGRMPIWTYVRSSPIDGGHYVPLVAQHDHLQVVSWGQTVNVTHRFLQEHCDEAWTFVSPEALRSGKSPEGFDLDALNADLKAL